MNLHGAKFVFVDTYATVFDLIHNPKQYGNLLWENFNSSIKNCFSFLSMCSPSLNSKRKIQAMKNLSNKKPAHKIFFASMMKFFAIEAVFAQINVSMQALECLTLHVAMWTQHWGDYACQAQRYATIDLIMCFGMHFIRPMLQMW